MFFCFFVVVFLSIIYFYTHHISYIIFVVLTYLASLCELLVTLPPLLRLQLSRCCFQLPAFQSRARCRLLTILPYPSSPSLLTRAHATSSPLLRILHNVIQFCTMLPNRLISILFCASPHQHKTVLYFIILVFILLSVHVIVVTYLSKMSCTQHEEKQHYLNPFSS